MTINNTISSYRKRRNQTKPLILGALAILLILVGVIVVVFSMRGGGFAQLFATKTFTPTITPLPTDTPTVTSTPTITPSATVTSTATPSAVYDYVVQEGEYLSTIIQDHGLTDNDLILIMMLNPGLDPNVITAGQTIKLPPPNYPFPTPTPLPTGLAPNSRINYLVMPGDSLGSISNKFLSTVDAIVAANQTLLTQGAETVIQPGWTLIVPIYLVTAVPTSATTPTLTPTLTQAP
jgi:LysM repeat protein